jgi:DeoR family transcriptional regulator, fructose operon transcriptional repressor
VVTNSLSIVSVLTPRPNINLLVLGGRLRPRTQATVDDWALRVLEETYVDVAFMATNGVSAERGLTTSDMAEAMVKRAMVRAARRLVLLADHTKVGNDHFTRFAGLDDFDCLITDTGIAEGLAEEIRAMGPRVVLA